MLCLLWYVVWQWDVADTQQMLGNHFTCTWFRHHIPELNRFAEYQQQIFNPHPHCEILCWGLRDYMGPNKRIIVGWLFGVSHCPWIWNSEN